MIMTAILSWLSLYMLTVTSKISKQDSFLKIARYAFGEKGERFTSLTMFIYLLGPLSAYFNICGSYLRSFIEAFGGHHQHYWYTDRLVLMILVGLLIKLPLSFASLKFLAYGSYIAVFAIFYAIVLVPVLYFGELADPTRKPAPIRFFNFDWSVLSALSTIGMAFVNHPIVVECVTQLENPTKSRQYSLTLLSTFTCLFLYLIIGVTGYLQFGENVCPNILDSENDGVSVQVARILVALGIALTYPLLMKPASEALKKWINGSSLDENRINVENNRRKDTQIIFFILCLSFFVASVVPSLDKILALFGSLTGSLIVYILPSIYFIKIMQRHGHGALMREWKLDLIVSKKYRIISWISDDTETSTLLPGDRGSRLIRFPNFVPLWILKHGLRMNLFLGTILFTLGSCYCFIDLLV